MTTKNNSSRAAFAARLPRDFMIGLGVLVFCAVAYWITLGFAEAPEAVAQNVQPATFPRMVLTVLAILSIGLMAVSFKTDSEPGRAIPLMVYATGAMMIGFVVLFQMAGIVVAMVAYCLTMPLLWGERRLHVILPFAVLFPAAIYLLFAVGLGVYFEAGVFGI